MSQVSIPISQYLTDELQESLWQGPMLDDEGRRLLNEEEVDRITNKMVATINANEHPPPHFHVTYSGEDASFDISTGRRLPRIRGLERFDKNIHKWWKTHHCELISIWNGTRPTDCQVGPVAVPPECQPADGKADAGSIGRQGVCGRPDCPIGELHSMPFVERPVSGARGTSAPGARRTYAGSVSHRPSNAAGCVQLNPDGCRGSYLIPLARYSARSRPISACGTTKNLFAPSFGTKANT